MKKTKFILQNGILLALLCIAFISCENDFNNIGTGIVGDDNFETTSSAFPIITYNQNIGPLQTNNLPVNILGYNNNSVFGSYTADFVSQMTPTQFNPEFGENVVLDSVVLTIPYFSRLTDTDDEGVRTYELDSIFGDSPIKLSVFRNNYFLRDFDPNSEFSDPQQYFSDKSVSPGQFISQSDLENEQLYSDDAFTPSAEELIFFELVFDENGDPVLDENGDQEKNIISRLAPSMRVRLDVDDDMDPNTTVFQDPDYWMNLIFDKEGEPELSNTNNFLDYFRGLFIKAEAVGPDGTMMVLDFSSAIANLTLYYTSDLEVVEGSDSEETTQAGTFAMNFSGINANFFDNNFIPLPGGDTVDGDEKLYLKGGEGSMAVINLFNGDDEGNSIDLEQFLADFRKTDANGDFMTGSNGLFLTDRLINEANLVFHVDQSIVDGGEPDRVFIYDVAQNEVLVDYLNDLSSTGTQNGAKTDHLHPLERVDDDPDGEGIKYKIEITEHINNILLRDSTNIKLGLLVTSNVLAVERYNIQDEDNIADGLVAGTILSPRGTVLFGNNTADEDKRVTFEIFYTEPEN